MGSTKKRETELAYASTESYDFYFLSIKLFTKLKFLFVLLYRSYTLNGKFSFEVMERKFRVRYDILRKFSPKIAKK